ncbi:MAG TPA: hypothetical protein VKB96_01235 [Gammaproteobacteria bacterium]|nr:hypothetical protein [Gammaproteobacteria bacterium]
MPTMVTMSRDACGHYTARFGVLREINCKALVSRAAGVDLGITHRATLADGPQVEIPKDPNKFFKLLQHRWYVLSRRRENLISAAFAHAGTLPGLLPSTPYFSIKLC